MTSSTAPVHPHATRVAVNPALFLWGVRGRVRFKVGVGVVLGLGLGQALGLGEGWVV